MIRATIVATLAVSTIASAQSPPTPQHRPLTNQEMQISYLCVQSPKGHALRHNYGTAIAVEVCNCFGAALMIPIINAEYMRATTDPARERIEDRLQSNCARDIEEMHKPLLRE